VALFSKLSMVILVHLPLVGLINPSVMGGGTDRFDSWMHYFFNHGGVMLHFYVFFCPQGGDIEAAKLGDILCPMIEVWAECIEWVRSAYPHAVYIG